MLKDLSYIGYYTSNMELHTFIKCSKCGYAVRASKHSADQCEGFRKFGFDKEEKPFKI